MSSDEPLAARVHTRALSRLKQIDEEIRAGRCPNARTLARRLERSERTVKRDLTVMRDQLGAPLVYDRARRGWRYLKPGWALPQQLNGGELRAFFTAAEVLRRRPRPAHVISESSVLSQGDTRRLPGALILVLCSR